MTNKCSNAGLLFGIDSMSSYSYFYSPS